MGTRSRPTKPLLKTLTESIDIAFLHGGLFIELVFHILLYAVQKIIITTPEDFLGCQWHSRRKLSKKYGNSLPKDKTNNKHVD